LIVLGYQSKTVLAHVSDLATSLKVSVIINRNWWRGLSASLKVGLRGLRPETTGAMIILGDQPLITSEMVNSLIEAYIAKGGPIVAPFYRGRPCHPIIFSKLLFQN
jgi:molybdenum cofactor cytidylyltransferase